MQCWLWLVVVAVFCKEELHRLELGAINYETQWVKQLSTLPPTVFSWDRFWNLNFEIPIPIFSREVLNHDCIHWETMTKRGLHISERVPENHHIKCVAFHQCTKVTATSLQGHKGLLSSRKDKSSQWATKYSCSVIAPSFRILSMSRTRGCGFSDDSQC